MKPFWVQKWGNILIVYNRHNFSAANITSLQMRLIKKFPIALGPYGSNRVGKNP